MVISIEKITPHIQDPRALITTFAQGGMAISDLH